MKNIVDIYMSILLCAWLNIVFLILSLYKQRLSYIYKSKHGVCLSVVTNKAGQGQGRLARADTRPQQVIFSYAWKATMVVFVCVGSAWKILPITARSLWSFPRCNSPDVIDSREKRN